MFARWNQIPNANSIASLVKKIAPLKRQFFHKQMNAMVIVPAPPLFPIGKRKTFDQDKFFASSHELS